MEDDQEQRPESLLPYEQWTETALRQVVVQAVEHVAANGLPGNHHFYLTFRTDHPGVVIPPRLRAKYPQEMTIVLQHQFWDLKMDREAGLIGVGLSFGGVPATLAIPLDAVIGFADPHVRYGLRFHVALPEAPAEKPLALVPAPDAVPEAEARPEPEPKPEKPAETPQVVSLDAFRRRSPPKE
ncbi:MAG TPA: ClpXP protease specificity-enhancing factor SspB [Acetobacteraceae bacterium]|nr:ClpXP protease specificity-enhancing factor SspB [Acetobacteraceae bacterium]